MDVRYSTTNIVTANGGDKTDYRNQKSCSEKNK